MFEIDFIFLNKEYEKVFFGIFHCLQIFKHLSNVQL